MKIEEIAKLMVTKGRGILAADESTGTMGKRLKSVNIESNEKNRLHFRETLFTSSAMKSSISGVILYDETIKQSSSEGIPIPELIKKNGSRFAKWRAVYSILSNQPSEQCIKANAHALARYAAIVQEAKMVPIVEPEVLMDGDHTIDKCYEVTSKVLIECFKELKINNVKLEGTVLKPNMILPGSSCKKKANQWCNGRISKSVAGNAKGDTANLFNDGKFSSS